MAGKALVWDEVGTRTYETGVSKGVLYVQSTDGTYPKGVAWNGLTTVTESPSGAEATALYADNIKYLNLISTEEFGATVECYTYPEEFAACNGESDIADGVSIGQQTRSQFGLCYRTKVGNDVKGDDYAYKIHLVYGCYATPSDRGYATVDDSPDAISFSYEISTTPVEVEGYKSTATVVIDSRKCPAEKLAKLEAILYGSETADARLPMPAEIATLIGTTASGTSAQSTTSTKAAN